MADAPKGPLCPVCAQTGRSMTMVLFIPDTPRGGFGGRDEQWRCPLGHHEEPVVRRCAEDLCEGVMRYKEQIIQPPAGAAGRGEYQKLPDPGGKDLGPGWECEECGNFELDTAPPTDTPATQD